MTRQEAQKLVADRKRIVDAVAIALSDGGTDEEMDAQVANAELLVDSLLVGVRSDERRLVTDDILAIVKDCGAWTQGIDPKQPSSAGWGDIHGTNRTIADINRRVWEKYGEPPVNNSALVDADARSSR